MDTLGAKRHFGGGGGGGLEDYGGSVTLNNCNISGNSTPRNRSGGGLQIFNPPGGPYTASATLTNCTVNNNYSGYSGGMDVGENCPLTMTNCTVSGNSALRYGGLRILSHTQATLTDCSITGNFATDPGFDAAGLYLYDCTTNLIGCTVSGNTVPANGSGGGLVQLEGSSTLTSCTFSGNVAGSYVALSYDFFGGGLTISRAGSSTLDDCTISGNNGAGIVVTSNSKLYKGSATLNDCTVSANNGRRAGRDIRRHAHAEQHDRRRQFGCGRLRRLLRLVQPGRWHAPAGGVGQLRRADADHAPTPGQPRHRHWQQFADP